MIASGIRNRPHGYPLPIWRPRLFKFQAPANGRIDEFEACRHDLDPRQCGGRVTGIFWGPCPSPSPVTTFGRRQRPTDSRSGWPAMVRIQRGMAISFTDIINHCRAHALCGSKTTLCVAMVALVREEPVLCRFRSRQVGKRDRDQATKNR